MKTPAKRPEKIPPPFSLRPVAPPDGPLLLRLYAETRAAELVRVAPEAAGREAFLRQQFAAREADYASRFPNAEHSIVVAEGKEIGVWRVWRGPQEIRLVEIALVPARRGVGIGGALLRRLADEARAARLPLKLRVREDNLAALRLYRRFGFRPETRENGYLALRREP